jgi:integrase
MVSQNYRALLEDENLKRWYKNTSRGSKVTADVYLRRLGNYQKKTGITPTDMLSKTESELHSMMLDLVTDMEQKYSGSYIKSIIKAIKSWLTHNGIIVTRKIKIHGSDDTPTLKNERVPTNDELKKIFSSGDAKTKVSCVLIAHSGLRLKSIGDYLGEDGLRIGDFPELILGDDGGVSFEKIPTQVVVRKELSKARHQYLSFLGEEGCDYLIDYLELRQRQGEVLTKDSAIVTPKRRMKPFIRATNVGDIIRNAIRKAGFSWRPYVLRSYFDTMLMLAESKGYVIRDYRQFWMGHKGDIENRYTTNKARLLEDVVEDMRESYRKSQGFLQTVKSDMVDEDRLQNALRRQLLLVAGFNGDEIDELDLNMDDTEFQETVWKRLVGSVVNNGNNQRVVGVDDVEMFIGKGWDFVAKLTDEKAIIKIS